MEEGGGGGEERGLLLFLGEWRGREGEGVPFLERKETERGSFFWVRRGFFFLGEGGRGGEILSLWFLLSDTVKILGLPPARRGQVFGQNGHSVECTGDRTCARREMVVYKQTVPSPRVPVHGVKLSAESAVG